MRDLANHIHPVRAISPAAAFTNNNPIVSQIIDTAGFSSIVFAIMLGAITAGATFAVTVDHGDDPTLADAAAVPSKVLTGTLALAGFASADANKLRKIGYVGAKRYVRLTITPTGNTSAFVSAVALLGDSRFSPTPNPPA